MIIVGNRAVSPNTCDHEASPPVCNCFHDWRIHWGNVPKQGSVMPTKQTEGWVAVNDEEEVDAG